MEVPKDCVRWEQFLLPDAILREKLAIYHGLCLPIPCVPIKGCKFILTLHDIIPWMTLDDESRFDVGWNRHLRKWLGLSLKKADIIVAVSEKTKSDILRISDLKPEKIRVVYNCVDPYFQRISNKTQMRQLVKAKLGLEGKFLLSVSYIRRRKNVETLINAYHRFCKLEKRPLKLVIVGNHKDFGIKNQVSSEIIFTGVISDQLLRCLYNLADVFIYPSSYEGFGYPPLEAMACGTPVIVSSGGALPEIVGDAAFILKRNTASDLYQAINKVFGDNTLRKNLMAKGLVRIKRFSWKKQASEMLRLYEEVGKS